MSVYGVRHSCGEFCNALFFGFASPAEHAADDDAYECHGGIQDQCDAFELILATWELSYTAPKTFSARA